MSSDASAEMVERIARGRLASPLPYGLLRDYGRADESLALPTIELANDLVRAVVLPTLGGRVWSLEGESEGEAEAEDDGRALIHENRRLRWANFGLTDAWFAGGIEWNLGSTGHGTTSNLPMHAAVLDTSLGPIVRLWEWERTRDLVLQVDLWLSGRRLMASTRVLNPDPEPKPLYYWTNIAVAETPGTRVLVPAEQAWRTDYTGELNLVSVPYPDGTTDVSFPSASRHAADYFYEVEDQEGRLVSAVEPDGRGLAQTSTSGLHGRKMFVWGHGAGGRRWQDWLGEPGSRYLEIQAGVCTTQLEHDLLDGHASRSWTEAFLPLSLDPSVVVGDYETAAYAVQRAVRDAAPPAWLEDQHDHWLTEVADVAPERLVHTGSGWGRAEFVLRGSTGSTGPTGSIGSSGPAAPAVPAGTPFPEVDDGSLPFARFAAGDLRALDDLSSQRPTPPVISDRWYARLSDVENDTTSWWVHYALGTTRHLRGDHEGARTAYGRSLELHESAVVLRGLALLSEDATERADLYVRALALTPGDRQLTVEWLDLLRDSGRADEVVAAVSALPEAVKAHGRVQLVLAESLAALGEDAAAVAVAILADLEVANLAEGDEALSNLWTRLRPDEPVPERLDFRMTPEQD